MLLFLANCRLLHVGDPLCISRAPSCARTCSIHSTQKLQVACGMESVCVSPFLLVYLGDEFLLWKCNACKPCYFMKKINKKLFIYERFSIMSNTIYVKINVEDNNFANIFRMDRNSAYVFFLKISRVIYKHFSELRL